MFFCHLVTLVKAGFDIIILKYNCRSIDLFGTNSILFAGPDWLTIRMSDLATIFPRCHIWPHQIKIINFEPVSIKKLCRKAKNWVSHKFPKLFILLSILESLQNGSYEVVRCTLLKSIPCTWFTITVFIFPLHYWIIRKMFQKNEKNTSGNTSFDTVNQIYQYNINGSGWTIRGILLALAYRS